jgi:hypothetical protein
MNPPTSYDDPIRQKIILMLIAWPPIIGMAGGLGLGILSDHIFTGVRFGAAFGLAGGACLATLSLLLMSGLLPEKAEPAAPPDVRIIDMPPPAPEQIRIVPFRGHGTRLIDGADEGDLSEFVEGLATRGHSQRAWTGVHLRSGRTIDADLWTQLSQPLRKAGIITGVAERSAGRLTESDPTRIKEILGIAA